MQVLCSLYATVRGRTGNPSRTISFGPKGAYIAIFKKIDFWLDPPPPQIRALLVGLLSLVLFLNRCGKPVRCNIGKMHVSRSEKRCKNEFIIASLNFYERRAGHIIKVRNIKMRAQLSFYCCHFRLKR